MNLPHNHDCRAYAIGYQFFWKNSYNQWIDTWNLWINHLLLINKNKLLNGTLTWWLAKHMETDAYVFELWSKGQSLPSQVSCLPRQLSNMISWSHIWNINKNSLVTLLPLMSILKKKSM